MKEKTHIEAKCATPDIIPHGDVVQSGSPSTVEKRVEEAKRRLARGEHCVIQERDDARKGRRGGGRSADQRSVPFVVDEEASRLR